MPKYAYTVVNQDNKQLSGTVNAPDEATARKQLNGLGFSILSIQETAEEGALETEQAAEGEAEIKKYEFDAIDKNGKRIVGTIQGIEDFAVYKRLINEYQFDVKSLVDASLPDEEKQKAALTSIDELRDKLAEEQLLIQQAQEKEQVDQREFELKQANLKKQVEFVLQKVNEFIETYKEELRPESKQKIKYFVEKVLRIKNSTNLEYVKQSCVDLLQYIQKEELFIHTEQRAQEKHQMALDAKTMMLDINKVNKTGNIDLFDAIREWRINTMKNSQGPKVHHRIINSILEFFLGPIEVPTELLTAKAKIKRSNEQLKQFIIIWLKAKDKNFKQETRKAISRTWMQRKQNIAAYKDLKKRLHEERLAQIEYTSGEIIVNELFKLSGWVLTFYIIYYFATIYLNSKNLPFIPDIELAMTFQTTIFKFFFTTLFLLVCALGIKIEFFKRKKFSTPIISVLFIFSSLLIVLNF